MRTPTFTYQLILRPLAIFLTIFAITACNQKEEISEKPVITVSILPQKYFVEAIANDQFDVMVMIPPGASPATYDPTPKQLMEFSKSKVYFGIGHIGFEKTWIRQLMKQYPNKDFVDLSKGIGFETIDFKHDDHSHQGIEPHVWMSALNAKLIVQNIADYLVKTYPENKEIYLQNLLKFHSIADSLHQSIFTKLDDVRPKDFIVYHPALTYFARDYGLNQIALEFEGKEPSTRYLSSVIEMAKAKQIRKVLVQKQFSLEEARVLTDEIDGKLLIFDPLNEDWITEMSLVADHLSQNKE